MIWFDVCLFVCLLAWLLACLLVCLLACLLVCLCLGKNEQYDLWLLCEDPFLIAIKGMMYTSHCFLGEQEAIYFKLCFSLRHWSAYFSLVCEVTVNSV